MIVQYARGCLHSVRLFIIKESTKCVNQPLCNCNGKFRKTLNHSYFLAHNCSDLPDPTSCHSARELFANHSSTAMMSSGTFTSGPALRTTMTFIRYPADNTLSCSRSSKVCVVLVGRLEYFSTAEKSDTHKSQKEEMKRNSSLRFAWGWPEIKLKKRTRETASSKRSPTCSTEGHASRKSYRNA